MTTRSEGYDKGYHTMNAHELVMRISDTSCLWTTKELAALESALRKAFIREASVGVVTFTKEDENTVVGFKEVDLLEIGKKYSGRYHLIPEENP
jgi:hypothetical protein